MHTQPPPYSMVVSQSAAANLSGQYTQPATGSGSAPEPQSGMGSQPRSAQLGSDQPSCHSRQDQTLYNTDVLSGNVRVFDCDFPIYKYLCLYFYATQLCIIPSC